MFLGSYIVIAVNVLFFLGVAVTYTMSMSLGHLKSMWCFISYTGNFPVESCIFSLVLNLCSGMYLLIVVLRYSQISHALSAQSLANVPKRINLMNSFSLVMGVMGSIGLSTTGSFQQRNVRFMHLAGVSCCIGCTNSYLLLQTFFSYTVMSSRTRTYLKVFRLGILILSSIAVLIGLVFLVMFFVDDPRELVSTEVVPDSDLSDVFKAGTVLEWLLFFTTLMYFFSFYPDLRKIALKRDRIVFLE